MESNENRIKIRVLLKMLCILDLSHDGQHSQPSASLMYTNKARGTATTPGSFSFAFRIYIVI